MTLKSAAVPVFSLVVEEDTASRSITKERSLSPLCVPRTEEQKEESSTTANLNNYLLSSSSILKKQIAVVNESILFPPDNPQLQGILQEDDENALHGSSEFMLVLYPEDEIREKDAIDMENSAEIRIRSNISKYE